MLILNPHCFSIPQVLKPLVVDPAPGSVSRPDGDFDLIDHRLEAAFVDRNRTQAATIAQATIVKIFQKSAN